MENTAGALASFPGNDKSGGRDMETPTLLRGLTA